MAASSTAYATCINIEKTRQYGPKIDSKDFDQLNQRPISRQEITLLNATDRTKLMDLVERRTELPQDFIDILKQQPSFHVDVSVLRDAVLTRPGPVYIPAVDVLLPANVSEQTGATAVAAEQNQQDCCNCCTLQ